MNKKGSSQGYARILDVVAGDQAPNNLDLAPDILTKIQKRRRSRMQPRMKLLSAAGLVAIVLAVLFYTVPGIASAVGRWFGYVPGVGFVREGQIRVLAEPVSVTREGITVTVDQAMIDAGGTVLLYSVDGIPAAASVDRAEGQPCPYRVSLRLPDGSPLLATPEGVQSWDAGYQHRFKYPALPTKVNEATLVIGCLFNTRQGAAPENWEIPLRFVPAPPEMTAFPVIEITTPTAEPPKVDPVDATDATALPTETQTAPGQTALNLTLDRAVQMNDGYLIYATLHWEDSPFASVDVINTTEMLHLLDGSGQEMRYEQRYDEHTGVFVDQRQTVLAIKTEPVQVVGPLTLVIDSVMVDLPVSTSFVFDPGENPQAGQKWTLNQDVPVGDYNLLVLNAEAVPGGYSFEMTSENGLVNAMLADLEHPIASGGSGGAVLPGQNFFSSFNYADGNLPKGPITITVGGISILHHQRLEAQWTPPAASPNQLPTQAAACLTTESWKAALAQMPPLPDGLPGRVLTRGPLNPDNSEEWGLALTTLDGSEQQVIPGAQDGTLSPDGTKLAYPATNDGIYIMDLATSEVTPLPGTGNGDFNPVWSPDGQQIVFNRGMGVFDLFITNLDGSEIRPLTNGGVQEWTVGWLPDGKHLLYTVPGRVNEFTTYKLDVQGGTAEVFSNTNLISVAPDGRFILTSESTFGDGWQVYVSETDGSNRWLLNDSSLWILTPIWSPDGQWLLAGVSDTGPAETIGALINLNSCQVIPLPHLKGSFLSWMP